MFKIVKTIAVFSADENKKPRKRHMEYLQSEQTLK